MTDYNTLDWQIAFAYMIGVGVFMLGFFALLAYESYKGR